MSDSGDKKQEEVEVLDTTQDYPLGQEATNTENMRQVPLNDEQEIEEEDLSQRQDSDRS